MTSAPYLHLDEIAAVVHKFENCEYTREGFTHSFHLAVAASYLSHYTPEESLDRMRAALLRFTKHHGIVGYHETITRFWLLLTADFLQQASPASSFTDRVNELIERFGRKELLFDYYTRDRVMSDEARNRWVEPDLQPIEAAAVEHRNKVE
jgi:hypothetical protein